VRTGYVAADEREGLDRLNSGSRRATATQADPDHPVRLGARRPLGADILKYARGAYPTASKVVVQGSFPMTDAYGNTSTDVILNVSDDRATLQNVNFDGVDPAKIWSLRDSGSVHPELQ
jgi:hypothetical protein